MITVERKRTLHAPPDRIRAALIDLQNMPRLMPRVQHVEVLSSNENRTRLALTLRFSKLGAQRIEGEARLLDDGLRFVAVSPMQVDTRWQIVPRGETTEVIARIMMELPKALNAFARFIPQRIIQDKIGSELEQSLDALAAITAQPAAYSGVQNH